MINKIINKPTVIFITLMVTLIVYTLWLIVTLKYPTEIDFKFALDFLKVFQTIISTILSNL